MTAPVQHQRPQHRMMSDTFAVGALLSVVKLAGAAKVVFTARVFGPSDAIDAFFIALLLPAFLAEVIAGSFTIALVPALVSALEQRGKAATERLVQTVSSGAFLLLTIACLLLAGASPWLLRWSASGFSDAKRALAQRMLFALLPLIPLSGVSIIWRSLLNAQRQFAIASAAPGMTPIVSIALLLLIGRRWDAWVQVAGMLGGIILEILLLGLALKRLGYALTPRWHGWTAEMKQMTTQYAPAAGMALLGQGNIVIDQSMAAMLGRGSVATFTYGTRFTTVLLGVGGTALTTALLPHLSRMSAAGDGSGLRQTMRAYLIWAVLVSVPMVALAYWLSPAIIAMLLQRGEFDAHATNAVISVQQLSLLQIPFALALAILLRLVASLRANSLLAPLAILGFTVNTVGDYMLLSRFGVSGIALAGVVTQSTSLLGAVALLLLWQRRRAALGSGKIPDTVR